MATFNAKPISQLTLLSTSIATNDVIAIVDVSDTTQSPSGTTKKTTVANLQTTFNPYPVAQTTVTTTNNTATTILTIPVGTTTGNIVSVTARLSCILSTGLSSAYCAPTTAAAWYNGTAVASVSTLPSISMTNSGTFAVSAAWQIVGNNLELKVTGITSDTILWACNYEYFTVNQ